MSRGVLSFYGILDCIFADSGFMYYTDGPAFSRLLRLRRMGKGSCLCFFVCVVVFSDTDMELANE